MGKIEGKGKGIAKLGPIIVQHVKHLKHLMVKRNRNLFTGHSLDIVRSTSAPFEFHKNIVFQIEFAIVEGHQVESPFYLHYHATFIIVHCFL